MRAKTRDQGGTTIRTSASCLYHPRLALVFILCIAMEKKEGKKTLHHKNPAWRGTDSILGYQV